MSFINWIKKLPFTPIQFAMHVYAWSELAIIIYGVLTHHLTANPIQAMEIDTGRHAIALLVLSLACTPLTTLTRLARTAQAPPRARFVCNHVRGAACNYLYRSG